MVTNVYIPNRGDIVWINLSPTKGHEQTNLRPALILSQKSYNQKTSLCIACPLTSHIKSYPFEVIFEGKKVQGAILSDHVRSLDWKQRDVRFIEKASPRIIEEVSEKLAALVN